jgi:hypothetical protein
MSRQGAKVAKAGRIFPEDFSRAFKVFMPKLPSAFFAPLREERSLCGVIS